VQSRAAVKKGKKEEKKKKKRRNAVLHETLLQPLHRSHRLSTGGIKLASVASCGVVAETEERVFGKVDVHYVHSRRAWKIPLRRLWRSLSRL